MTRTRLSAYALAAIALLGACAEQEAAAPSGSDDRLDAAGWKALTVDEDELAAWEPVYADVQPAGQAELDHLLDRAAAAAARPYTVRYALATLEGPDIKFEVAHTAEHTRVGVSAYDGQLRAELHLEGYRPSLPPNKYASLDSWSHAVACVDGQGCKDLSASRDDETPHLFGVVQDPLLMAAASVADSTNAGTDDRSPTTLLPGRVLGTATAASPYGPLTCVVAGVDDASVLALEGEPVRTLGLMADGLDTAEATAADGWCLDERGLVVTESPFDGAGWTSFQPTAPDDLEVLSEPLEN